MSESNKVVSKALKRLKQFRKALLMTQKEFGESISYSRANYSRIESGKGQISFILIYELVKTHNLNPLWLINGEGSMFIQGEDEYSRIRGIVEEVLREKGIE